MEPEQKAVEECMRLMGQYGAGEPAVPKNPSADQLPTMSGDPFEAEQMERGFWDRWFSWFAKSNEQDNSAHLKTITKVWRSQLQQRKNTWLKEWVHRHFETYCETRRKHYQEWASKAEAKLETQAAVEEKAVAEAEMVCEQMASDLKTIKARLTNALATA